MAQTPNLGLTTTGREENTIYFIDYRDALSGTDPTSNMNKIDTFAGTVLGRLNADVSSVAYIEDSSTANTTRVITIPDIDSTDDLLNKAITIISVADGYVQKGGTFPTLTIRNSSGVLAQNIQMDFSSLGGLQYGNWVLAGGIYAGVYVTGNRFIVENLVHREGYHFASSIQTDTTYTTETPERRVIETGIPNISLGLIEDMIMHVNTTTGSSAKPVNIQLNGANGTSTTPAPLFFPDNPGNVQTPTGDWVHNGGIYQIVYRSTGVLGAGFYLINQDYGLADASKSGLVGGIANNLTTTDATKVLSANMGATLENTKAPIANPAFTGSIGFAEGNSQVNISQTEQTLGFNNTSELSITSNEVSSSVTTADGDVEVAVNQTGVSISSPGNRDIVFSQTNRVPLGVSFKLTASLLASGWSSAAPYTQVVSVQQLLASDTPVVGALFDSSQAIRAQQREAWGLISDAETGNGTLTFYCDEEIPTVDIPIQIQVVR